MEELTALHDKGEALKRLVSSDPAPTEIPVSDSGVREKGWTTTTYESSPVVKAILMPGLDAYSRVSPSIDRVYPRVVDPTSEIGSLRTYVERAAHDARNALASFDEGEVSDMASNLSLSASMLTTAYDRAGTRDALAAILAFLRRSLLFTDASEITRAMLNGLISTLNELQSNPLIELEDAAGLADALSEYGWNGDEETIARLVSDFLLPDEAEFANSTAASILAGTDN